MVLTQLVSRRLTLRNGVELSYAEQGPADGTPVVLLHGYSDSWRSFAPLMAQLPASFHILAMTQRGHGDSTKPDAYAMRDFAADVAAFCDRVGIERPIVVGHSMGSLVATRFAIDYPERLGRLVLIGAFKTLRGSPAAAALWQGVSELTDPVSERFVHEFQASTVARPVSPAFLTTVIAESLKLPARVWKDVLRPMLDEDCSAELLRIRAPACVIWGAKDGLTDLAEQKTLASLIGGRLIVYPDAGHAPHWEDPAQVADEIAAFVREPAHTGP